MENLFVLVLLGMNLCLAKSLADTKETTIVDVFTEPVKKASNKVIATTKDVTNKAINKAKSFANKVTTKAKDMTHKAVDYTKDTVDKCEVAVNKAVSDMTNFTVTNLRIAEEMIMKQTTIYKEMKVTNDSLMARIDELEALLTNNNTNDDLLAQITELQARLDDITDKYNALENKKQIVNRPKNVKKPVKVDNPFAVEHIDGYDVTEAKYVRDANGNWIVVDTHYEKN